MPVNFQQLAPIQAPQVIATLPQNNQPSALGALGQGIQAGVKNYQDAQLNQKQSELADVQIEKGKMDIEDKQEARRQAAEIKQAAQQGWDNLIKVQMQYDPVAAMTMLKAQAEIPKLVQETQGLQEDNTKKGLENYDNIMSHLGALSAQTSGLTDENGQPRSIQEKQAFFNQGLTFFPKSIQGKLAEQYPNGWDENVGAVLTHLGTMSQANIAAQNEGKKQPSDTKKRLDELDAQRIQAGQSPLSPQERADVMQKGLNTSINPKKEGLDPATQVNIGTTTDRLKETGKSASIAQANIGTLNQMENFTDAAMSGKGSGTQLTINKFLEFAGIPVPKGTAPSEVFNSLNKQAQLTAQQMLKGSSSDRDMEIVAQTGPQLDNTKAGRKMMISAAKYKATTDIQYNAFLNAYQNANSGNLDGADEAWNNFIQSRKDFDKKNLTFNSDGLKRENWKPFLDPNYKAPKTYEEGQIYKDANGNRAKYVNGKWESI